MARANEFKKKDKVSQCAYYFGSRFFVDNTVMTEVNDGIMSSAHDDTINASQVNAINDFTTEKI